MKYVDVILPLPLHDTFTYAVPPEMEEGIKRGCRVVVPFGAKKIYTAIVIRVHDVRPDFDNIKPIKELLETTPVVTERQLQFWEWIAKYYICSMGDVYKAALPAGLKPKDKDAIREKNKRRRLSLNNGTLSDISILSPLSEAQNKAYGEIIDSFDSHPTTLLHGVTSSGKTEI